MQIWRIPAPRAQHGFETAEPWWTHFEAAIWIGLVLLLLLTACLLVACVLSPKKA
ncbi:MAG TPA: hypothetical protein VFB80_15265 [Pirellulaceae bacterium]|nr:hypothetical protein [Pirellulaceae bacterium]